MKYKILFFTLLTVITFSCNFSTRSKSKQRRKSETKFNEKTDAGNLNSIPPDKTLLNIDLKTINEYKSIDEDGSEYIKTFKNQLLKTINYFKDKPIDTTILTIGYINNDALPDTIVNRIFLKDSVITIMSKWAKGHKTQWKETIINPYMWINEKLTPSNDPTNTDLWVTLTIALYYSLPELVKKDEFNNISIDFVFPDLHHGEKKKAIEYLKNSFCDFLIHGEPEARKGLYLWYTSKKQFILYYAP